MMKGACGGELSLAYFLTPFTVTKFMAGTPVDGKAKIFGTVNAGAI